MNSCEDFLHTSPAIKMTCFRYLFLLLPTLSCSFPLIAADSIEVKEGDSIRTLSEKHLGDSELWPEFLRANELDSVAEVVPGMRLKLPATEIIETEGLIREVRNTIQQANRLRARLFATREIGTAIAMRDSALEQKRQRNWKNAWRLMKISSEMASKALEICEQKRNVAAEAQLIDMKGTVERRRPADSSWNGVDLYQMLSEGERVRTLSDSTAELLFQDYSRLRLDENSQLVIREMRSNLLENRQQAKVSLVSGDLFALLGGTGARDDFDLELPDIELDGNSRDFYVKQEKDNTKLANYNGELKVASRGSNVVLEENEGVAVDGSGISGKRSLLPRPALSLPSDAELIYTDEVPLSWQQVEGASKYWLEVASDTSFKAIRVSDGEVKDISKTLAELSEGTWYWRVSAVDKDGFPGPRSAPRSFQLIQDRQPPYLALLYPEQGQIVAEQSLELRGIVESGAELTVNGVEVKPDKEGDFSYTFTSELGENQLKLVARDMAGNLTEIGRDFSYVPERELFVELAPSVRLDGQGQLLATGELLDLRMGTLPGALVRAVTADDRILASARANLEGHLNLSLPLFESPQRLNLQLVSPRGRTMNHEITLVSADLPPRIVLSDETPAFQREDKLSLGGQVRNGSSLTLNGDAVELEPDGKFQLEPALNQGRNQLELVAQDGLGRSSRILREIWLDREPPKLTKKSVKITRLDQGNQVLIALQASDDASLPTAVPYTLIRGDFSHQGLLRLDADQTTYRGLVLLPGDQSSGKLQFSVVLSDHVGNSQSVEFSHR